MCRLMWHLCPQEEECTSSSWGDSKMYKPSTIANSQRKPIKINKNDSIAKISVLVEQVRATIKILYLYIIIFIFMIATIFRTISNEMFALRLILCWWYFSYLQMYSEKFFNVYFYEQMFFEIFLANDATSQFFLKNNG